MTAGGGAAPEPHDRWLTADDLSAYLRLRETSFGYPGDGAEALERFRAYLPRTVGAFIDGELVSCVTLHRYRPWVAGRVVTAGGLGAIQTAPEHRRSRHVARLMSLALSNGREERLGWNLLYPFDGAFYARFGWTFVPTTVRLELPLDRLPAGRPRMLHRIDGAAAAGLGVPYRRFAASRTFADTREVGPWNVWGELDGAPGERLLRYAADDAFVAVRLRDAEDGLRLEVLDLGWIDGTGRDAVWGTLAAFRGQVDHVRIDVPWEDPVAVEHTLRYAAPSPAGMMARVADLESALPPLRAVADDDTPLDLPPVVVRVMDGYCPWNDGIWHLQPGPDGVVLARSNRAPAASLDVRALAGLLSGAAAPSDVRRLGWAEGDGRALAVLASLSGGRRPYRSRLDAF